MTMKPVAIIPQLDLPFRETRAVDAILGPKRKNSSETSTVDWRDCQLAKAYPTLDVFLQAIAEDRRSALAEGRLPHPATRAPPQDRRPAPPREAPPWEAGPSAADVRKAYGTKHA